MSVIQSRPITEEELIRLAEMPGVEYAHGQIEEKHPVTIETGDIEVAISSLRRVEALKTRIARIFSQSLSYQCFPEDPPKFRRPDVSVIKSERLAGFDPRTSLLPIPPDLAVEVISPNDLAYAVAEKVQEYLGAGFPLIWIVEPNTRTVTIYRADGSVTILREPHEITGESALPGFKCKVGEFFETAE